MHEWASPWIIAKAERPITPITLTHKPCVQAFEGDLVCDACEEPLVPSEVRGSNS